LEREGAEGNEQQIGQQMDSKIALVSVTYKLEISQLPSFPSPCSSPSILEVSS
jgi:hypothetical protein